MNDLHKLPHPISIIIPAYNEEESIKSTVEELLNTYHGALHLLEIIVVNDGSTDQTAAKVRAFPQIRLLQHETNRGYGAALKTGIRNSTYPIIVITDADRTYPNEEIPQLVNFLQDYDMAVGARTGQRVNIPLIRRPAKWLLNQLANYLSGIKIPDLNSGLRAFKRDIAIKYFSQLPDGFSFTTTITLAMLTNNYNVKYHPINYYKRTGNSKIKPIRDTINFFSLVIRTILYYRPLRIFIPVSSFLIILSAAKFFYDIVNYDFHIATSTVVLITLTFQTIVLGLIADLIVSLYKANQ